MTDVRNGITRMALDGELDMGTVNGLTDALEASERNGSSAIMVDLRDVSFMDSTGLHAVLQARTRSIENGHRLLLVGVSDLVRKLFELTGMGFVLDEHEAVSMLDQFTRDERGNEDGAEPGDPRG